jgi:pyridoxal 5'-phosphate synthase pdxT subunit
MVKELTIGVLGIQGAVSEHINLMEKTLHSTKTSGKVIPIKNKEQLDEIDALIIPGGESTTITKILNSTLMHYKLINKIKKDNLPVMGTCAGCVVLASEIVNNNNLNILSVMNIKVKRNAFGRQKESFEKQIDIKGFSKPFNAVFIRAPIIERVWDDCRILSKIDKKIVMAKQDNLLALSFHPELTDDIRIHKFFLNMI